MKLTKFPKKLKRRYLRMASVYRRFAERSSHYDFSLQALLDCYEHETNGKPVDKMNGYVYGKWCKDVSVVMWREDIINGHFCKIEFYTPCNKWWAEPALESIISPIWFPFEP